VGSSGWQQPGRYPAESRTPVFCCSRRKSVLPDIRPVIIAASFTRAFITSLEA